MTLLEPEQLVVFPQVRFGQRTAKVLFQEGDYVRVRFDNHVHPKTVPRHWLMTQDEYLRVKDALEKEEAARRAVDWDGQFRLLTIRQPYATLIALGEKLVETRIWDTAYRGWLGIHAGLGLSRADEREYEEIAKREPCRSILASRGLKYHDLPRSAVLAVCRIEECVPGPAAALSLSEQEIALGSYSDAHFGFFLGSIRPLPTVVRVKGCQGLWKSPWVARKVNEAFGEAVVPIELA